MKHSKSEYRLGIGASSLLMVLVVLALTALSLLSLHSAQNTMALTKRSLDMNVAYYEAAAEAQRKLAALDELLLETDGDLNLLREQAEAAGLTDILLTEKNGALSFRFTLDAASDRMLAVEGDFSPAGTPRLTLTRHELVSAPVELEDEPLRLLEVE